MVPWCCITVTITITCLMTTYLQTEGNRWYHDNMHDRKISGYASGDLLWCWKIGKRWNTPTMWPAAQSAVLRHLQLSGYTDVSSRLSHHFTVQKRFQHKAIVQSLSQKHFKWVMDLSVFRQVWFAQETNKQEKKITEIVPNFLHTS